MSINLSEDDIIKKRLLIEGDSGNEDRLINLYDSCNIIILPSYTEAHPKVIDEALSRMRPVIVFDDIKYVVNNRHGVFSVTRDSKKLIELINFIKKNNTSINSSFKKNTLPKKEVFLKDLYRIVSVA